MEEISIQESISQVWNKLKDNGYTDADAKRVIYKEFMKEGISFRTISDVLHSHNFIKRDSISFTKRPEYGTESIFYGCQTNEYGYVIDPITLEEIDEDLLISYQTNGKKFCFDISSLYRWTKTHGEMINPLTRELLPDQITRELTEYGKSRKKCFIVKYDNKEKNICLEYFSTIGDLIIESIKILEGSLLENISSYDVLDSQRKSLYLLDVTHNIDINLSNIFIESFSSQLHKSDSLLEMFEFTRKRRGNETYDSIYLHLGGVLSMVPVIRVEGGLNYTVLPNSRIIDILLTCYEFLGGLNTIKNYNIVLEDGTDLVSFGLDELAINIIPSENIYHVTYENDDDKESILYEIYMFAFNNNMVELTEKSSPYFEGKIEPALKGLTLSDSIDDFEMLHEIVTNEIYTLKELEDFILLAIKLNKVTDVYFTWPTIYKENTENFIRSIFNATLQKDDINIFLTMLEKIRTLGNNYNKTYIRTVLDKVLRTTNIAIVPDNLKYVFYTSRVYNTSDSNLINLIKSIILNPTDNHNTPYIIGRLDLFDVFKKWMTTNPSKNDILDCLKQSLIAGGHEIIDNCSSIVNPNICIIPIINYGTLDQFKIVFIGKTREEFNALFTFIYSLINFHNRSMAEFLVNDERLDKESVNIAIKYCKSLFIPFKTETFSYLINSPFFSDYEYIAELLNNRKLYYPTLDNINDIAMSKIIPYIEMTKDMENYLQRRNLIPL